LVFNTLPKLAIFGSVIHLERSNFLELAERRVMIVELAYFGAVAQPSVAAEFSALVIQFNAFTHDVHESVPGKVINKCDEITTLRDGGDVDGTPNVRVHSFERMRRFWKFIVRKGKYFGLRP
jgi:hypothetical protein